AHGMIYAVDENATMTLLINNNNISNTSSDGIFMFNNIAPGGVSTLNATITGNTIAGHNSNAGNNADVAGIAIFGGVEAADNTNIDIRNNAVSGNPNPAIYFDYYIDGNTFGDQILVKGIGVGAVTEAAFLAPGDGTNTLNTTSTAAAGSKTFIVNTFFNNNAAIPQPSFTPLQAAQGQGPGDDNALTLLTLAPIFSEAVHRWEDAGLTADQIATL